jgi:formylglycine-generating enzyme required for sulfatase activity
MAVIAPGHFDMGSPAGEPDRSGDEGPRHEVTIPRPFALGQCEVTVGQFRQFAEETDYRTEAERGGGCYAWNEDKKASEQQAGRNWRDPGFEQTDRHPAVCVSHADAEAYARWLARRTGAPYRLPTEAEWEYAARAGTDMAYPWGADALGTAPCRYANGADLSARAQFPAWTTLECADGFLFAAPAGSFEANGFGLHDMSGNVWEWTADCWHDSYEGAPQDGAA